MREGKVRFDMYKRALNLLPLLLSCILLSGCFEFKQEYWINADGSGRVLMDIGIVQIDQGNKNTRKQDSSEFEKNMQEARQRLSADPNIKRVSMSQETRDGMLHTVFDIECRDMTKFNEAMRKSAEKARENSPSGEVGQADDAMTPIIEKLSNGDYSFKMKLERNKGKKPDSNPAAERIAEQWMQNLFAGRFFTVTLHAPKISESNGQTNATSNLVEWKIPMTQIATDKVPIKELTAHVVTPSIISPQRWLPELTSASAGWGFKQYAILAGAGIILLIASLIIVKSLRKA